MTFGNYIYQDNRDQTRQKAIEAFVQSADALQAGHLKAVEGASQLKTTIANLDMNEEEDGFKNKLVSQLQSTIDNNIQYGNMYYALDDILKMSGDLLSDPAVVERIKSQQNFTKFRDELDKNTKLPTYMKNMYKDLNPYHSPDVDDNGNPLVDDDGNTVYKRWEPKNKPVDHIDGVALADKAIQRIKSDIGGGTSIRFRDGDGNVVKSDSPDAATIEYYSTVSQKWEKVTAERLMGSYIGLMKNDPAIRASISQEIKAAEYAKSHGDNTDYGLYKSNGQKRTYDEYIAWKFFETAQNTAWIHNIISEDIHNKKGGGSGSGYSLEDIFNYIYKTDRDNTTGDSVENESVTDVEDGGNV